MVAFLLVISLIMGTSEPVLASPDPDWLEGWSYRKQQTITGTTAGTQENYQMKMIVHKGSGTDNITDVFCGGNCRDDFGDIRWTEDDGSTPMDYWIEELVSGEYAIFWVELPSIPAGAGTVDCYIYYDKSDATTTSNGEATFVFFDDAESGSPSDKWTWTANLALTYDVAEKYQGAKSLKTVTNTGGDGANAWYAATGINIADAVFEAYVKTGWQYHMISGRQSPSAATGYCGRPNAGGVSQLYKFVDGAATKLDEGTAQAYDAWHKWSIVCYGTSIKFLWNDIELCSTTDPAISSGSIGAKFWFTDKIFYMDVALVRKYVDPEPTWGAWGEEETPPQPPTEPGLIKPIENQPYFEWTTAEYADNYRLLIDNNIGFSSPWENRVLIENYYQIPVENALDNGVYWWKVIAQNAVGENASDVWNFTVGGAGVEGIDLVAAAMFLLPIVLMGISLAFDNPVFASLSGMVFIISGVYFIDITWLMMIFIGLGIYLLVIAFMNKED